MSLHFVKDNVNIDFVGKRKLGFCLSGTLILLALLSMFSLPRCSSSRRSRTRH